MHSGMLACFSFRHNLSIKHLINNGPLYKAQGDHTTPIYVFQSYGDATPINMQDCCDALLVLTRRGCFTIGPLMRTNAFTHIRHPDDVNNIHIDNRGEYCSPTRRRHLAFHGEADPLRLHARTATRFSGFNRRIRLPCLKRKRRLRFSRL